MKSFRISLAAAVVLIFISAVTAGAATVTFTPGHSTDLTGYTQGGFTFGEDWQSDYDDGRNAPFMEYYDRSHSIVYDGTFTFNSMMLGAWPHLTYGNGSGTLNIRFFDINGALIDEGSIYLPSDASLYAYTDTVSGVHSILFPATGGFWPRLDSITFNSECVPEPATMLLLGLGMLGLAGIRRMK